MSKPHNKNISKVYSYFQLKMLDLQIRIDALKHECSNKKLALTIFNECLKQTDGDDRELLIESIHDTVHNYTALKLKRNKLIAEYKEIKQMYKTVQRGFEERYMDGFAEGVRFAVDDEVEIKYKN